MISTKKLIKMVKKWQRRAMMRQRRITIPRTDCGTTDSNSTSSSSVANKGHVVVYTVDQSRFVIPIVYLNNWIIRELFKMSAEEFGLPSSGPITLPCDAVFMEYVISLINLRVEKDLEKALLMFLTTGSCSLSSYLHQEPTNNQLLLCGH